MDWKTVSRLFFAVTMIAIGIIGLAGGGFAPIWRPVPDATPGRQILAYLCTFISLATGAGLLTKRSAAPAALVLLIYLLVWTALFKVPFIIRAPLVEVSYQSCGQNAVLIAAARILYGWSARNGWRPSVLVGGVGLRIAHILYGLALVAFGLAQFIYLNLTVPLVPVWMPGPVFWSYLTGSVYIATGIAIVADVAGRLCAALSAVQIALITLLVWTPIVLAGHMSPIHWQESIESWALTASAWVVAMSFDGRPWLDRSSKRARPRRNATAEASQ